MVLKTVTYFDNMSATIPTTARRTWEREISSAEKQRLTDPSGMDILAARDADSTRTQPLPSLADDHRSVPAWLQMALSIQERQ